MGFSAVLCISSFCVLMASSIPALRQLGCFAAFSLICGFLIALYVLPACPWIDRPALPRAEENNSLALKPHLLPTILLALLCLSVCILGLNKIPFDSSFQSQGADSYSLQQEFQELRLRWQMNNEPPVWASSGATLDDALKSASTLAAALRSLPESDEAFTVFSLADILPPEKVRSANIARWNAFVHKHADLPVMLTKAAKTAGFKESGFAGFSGWFMAGYNVPENPLDFLAKAGLAQATWWLLLEKDNAYHVLSFGGPKPFPGFEGATPGNSVLLSASAVAHGLNQAFLEEIYLLPLAGAICLLLLILCFKRPVLVLLSSLPPLFGVAAIITWMLLAGRSMTLPGAAALILVIGLGSDYGIVMLHELRSSFSLGAFRSILISGLTTLTGLGVLILAKHPVLQTLGGVTFFGLTAELLTVLLAVPFLCKNKRNHDA
jgi:predicted exporter